MHATHFSVTPGVEVGGAGEGHGEGRLRRDVGGWLAGLIVVNATIGTGIFKTPAHVARSAGSVDAALLVWCAGAAVALSGALSLAELAAAMPRTGGLYEYIRRAYGRGPAFVLGWTKLTLLMPSSIGGFARLAAEATASIVGLAPDPRRESIVAAAFVAASTAANLLGVRANAAQQAIVTVAKYAGVVLVGAVGCFVAARASPETLPLPTAAPFAAAPTAVGLFAALVSVMWAYDGWADLSLLAGEVRSPERVLPRALVLGTIAVGVAYLVANVGYARVLGIEGLRRSGAGGETVAANLATLTLGAAGRRAVSLLVLVSCLGGCMSTLLTSPRMLVALSSDGLFPRVVGDVSARGVPRVAVLLGGALGVVFVSFRSFEQLTDAFVFGFFPFYMAAVAGVFVLRRRAKEMPRPFRVPGYPVTPVVFLAGAAAVIAGSAGSAGTSALFAFAAMAAGVPVYFAWKRWAAPPA